MTDSTQSVGRSKRRRWGAVLVTSLVVVAAACGSSSTKSTSTTASTASATGAASASAAGGDAIAQAKTDLAKYETRPTSVELATPIDKPIPGGKTLYFIACGSDACNFEGDIIKQATDLLGWNLKVLNTNGTPQQQQSAWEQAIREKPFGVLYTATPRATIDKYLKQAKDAGIGVASCCVTDPVADGIDYNISTVAQTQRAGAVYGAWAVATAADLKAKFVVVTVPDFPILVTLKDSILGDLHTRCPDCSADNLDVPLTALGKNAPDLIVSYLRAHPDVKQMLLTVDALALGLPAAMKAAGLDDVAIFGEGPGTTNLQYLANGDEAASMAFPYYEDMFGMVDAMARKAAGVAIIPAFDPPLWILTKDNLPSSTELFALVPGIKDQFAKLWGKSA